MESIGEIIITSTSEITGQCRRGTPPFTYGSLISAGKTDRCMGVVFNVETTSVDPTRRATAFDMEEEQIRQRHPQLKMLLRNQFQALLIGSMHKNKFLYGLPATPPGLHAQIVPCSEDEIREIGANLGFLRLLYDSGKSSSEELILGCCRNLLDALGWRDEHAVRIGKALSDLYRDDYDALRRTINRLESWLNQ